jgi:hypothetical protein
MQAIILQPVHIGCRVFILTEARSCINSRVSYVSLFSTTVSTPTLKLVINHDINKSLLRVCFLSINGSVICKMRGKCLIVLWFSY